MKGIFAIGADRWPGLSKLVEECGEVVQVVGKLIGTAGATAHWDGSNLKDRLLEEMADVTAAVRFVLEKNGMNVDAFERRVEFKLLRFNHWHTGEEISPDVSIVDCPKCVTLGPMTGCSVCHGKKRVRKIKLPYRPDCRQCDMDICTVHPTARYVALEETE